MRLVTIAFALCLFAVRVSATPIVNISGATQWQTAISNGSIVGIQPTGSSSVDVTNTAALNKIYPAQSTSLANTQVATNTSPVNGLASQVGTAANQNLSTIGGVAYIGPDPDWSDYYAHFDPYLPEVGPPGSGGFDMFSFAIIDTSGNVKAWTWDSTVLATGFNNFVVKMINGAGEGGSNGFYMDGGFDITQGQYLQFGYRGTPKATTPGLDPYPDGTLASGIHEFTVTPESDGLVLFGCGLIGMALGRYILASRRKARTASS